MPNPIKTLILCMFLLLTPVTTHVNPTLPTFTKQEQHRIVQEYTCIKTALYHEARGEPTEGIKAVLSVIHNRTKHEKYPESYCGVIKQPRQFSYYNTIKHDRTTYKPSEAQVRVTIASLAFEAAIGSFKGILHPSVVMYHSAKMKSLPVWASKYKKYATIGNHQFYRS